MEAIRLLGINFDDLRDRDVVEKLLARPPVLPFAYIVTPNADHIARLRKTPRLRIVYQSAWLRLLDSRLLRNGARMLGLPAPAVATGTAISAQLLRRLSPQTVAVIGMQPRDIAALRQRYPDLRFVHHAPPMNLLRDRAAFYQARDFVLTAGARFTFIALGSPAQEMLAYAVSLDPDAVGTALCIGGALKFCAGTAARAPFWMQAAGLEWLHRLVRDPGRLSKRYLLDDPPVLGALVAEGVRRKVRR